VNRFEDVLTTIQTTLNGSLDAQVSYDPFTMASTTGSQTSGSGQYNPYLESEGNLAAAGAGYYPTQTTYTAAAQPVSKLTRIALRALLTK
jgi:hypothetical protein